MADIAQFNANMSKETLIASSRLHNRFPPDTAFPQIDVLSDDFKELCAIVVKYNAQNHFQLRLLHRHTSIPEGHILLGTSISNPPGFWTSPTPISDVDLQNIYPHIISVDAASYKTETEKRNSLLFPSEFREGRLANVVGNIDSNFFIEFTDCLWAKGLINILGLEVVQDQTGRMIEFSFDTGSLLLKEEEVKTEIREERSSHFTLQETGWTITVEDGTVYSTGIIGCARYLNGDHIRYKDEKALGVSDVVRILKKNGVLAT